MKVTHLPVIIIIENVAQNIESRLIKSRDSSRMGGDSGSRCNCFTTGWLPNLIGANADTKGRFCRMREGKGCNLKEETNWKTLRKLPTFSI